MKKGTIVLVKATVTAEYRQDALAIGDPLELKPNAHPEDAVVVYEAREGSAKSRNLYRWPCEKPWEGLVVGTSYRATGLYSGPYGGSFDYSEEVPCLVEDKRHPVVMVQPLHTERWLKPVACLEQDLAEEV